MTSYAAWPVSLSSLKFTIEGSAFSYGRNVASFQPDVGRAIERARTTVVDDVMTLNCYPTHGEVVEIESFYKVMTKQGTLPFTMVDPTLGQVRAFQFRSPPAFGLMGGRGGQCSIDLLRLGT